MATKEKSVKSTGGKPDKTAKEKPSKKYLQCLELFILKPITNDEENERAAQVCDAMLERIDSLTKQERYYFETLTKLVSDYESKWNEEKSVSPRELLSFLMEQNNLTQTALIAEFGSSSRASEYLSGKRPHLSLNQIVKLAKRFKLSMTAFISNDQIQAVGDVS
ncbi:MAG: hypothetical protein IT342_25580 [Candidatus Melainabacteria bacterium]|nr:hypothetical protein [Candidatus Melainabacteria bacterium]